MGKNLKPFDETETDTSKLTMEGRPIYLNNAGQARLDPEVQEVGREVTSRMPWEMHGEEDQKRIRELYAVLVGAKENEISIMPSTAFATTLAARNVQRMYQKNPSQKKNKILLLQDQFCSAVYPWQELCDESLQNKSSIPPLRLKIVPYPTEKQNWTQAILEKMTEDVLVTMLPPLHWSDGALLDLKVIGEACKSRNILYMVDSTQAVGIMPCRVADIGNPLLMACSVHKWLRGPPGASLVYLSPELYKNWIPLDQHGRSRDMKDGASWDASKDEMGPHGYPEKYFDDARKFDSGGKPNPILLPMIRKALEQVVLRVDLTTCQAELQRKMKPVLDWALVNGFTLTPGPHASHLVGIRPSFLTPQQMLDVASKLQAEYKIFIAVRCGCFRIAPYLDTTNEEIERFVSVLKEACQGYSS